MNFYLNIIFFYFFNQIFHQSAGKDLLIFKLKKSRTNMANISNQEYLDKTNFQENNFFSSHDLNENKHNYMRCYNKHKDYSNDFNKLEEHSLNYTFSGCFFNNPNKNSQFEIDEDEQEKTEGILVNNSALEVKYEDNYRNIIENLKENLDARKTPDGINADYNSNFGANETDRIKLFGNSNLLVDDKKHKESFDKKLSSTDSNSYSNAQYHNNNNNIPNNLMNNADLVHGKGYLKNKIIFTTYKTGNLQLIKEEESKIKTNKCVPAISNKFDNYLQEKDNNLQGGEPNITSEESSLKTEHLNQNSNKNGLLHCLELPSSSNSTKSKHMQKQKSNSNSLQNNASRREFIKLRNKLAARKSRSLKETELARALALNKALKEEIVIKDRIIQALEHEIQELKNSKPFTIIDNNRFISANSMGNSNPNFFCQKCFISLFSVALVALIVFCVVSTIKPFIKTPQEKDTIGQNGGGSQNYPIEEFPNTDTTIMYTKSKDQSNNNNGQSTDIDQKSKMNPYFTDSNSLKPNVEETLNPNGEETSNPNEKSKFKPTGEETSNPNGEETLNFNSESKSNGNNFDNSKAISNAANNNSPINPNYSSQANAFSQIISFNSISIIILFFIWDLII